VALVIAASRRQNAWLALFALLLVLLNALPFFIFESPVPAGFLAIYDLPIRVMGRGAWIVLLPALIPGTAFVYTLITLLGEHGRPVVAKETSIAAGVLSNKAD
jgi:hypothetical protein